MQPQLLIKVLENQKKLLPSNKKLKFKFLSISKRQLNGTVATLHTENCHTSRLEFGDTRDCFDQRFRLPGIMELRVMDNNHTDLSYLRNTAMDSLLHISITDSDRIKLGNLINHIDRNTNLLTLRIINCRNTDRDTNMAEIQSLTATISCKMLHLDIAYMDKMCFLTEIELSTYQQI